MHETVHDRISGFLALFQNLETRKVSIFMESNAQRGYFMDLVHLSVTESYPLELLYVKALFLQKQYRRCVTTCRELLDETVQPLQLTFIQFYLALAHDELARAIHNYSQAKIPAFRQAEQLYRDVLQALPAVEQCIRPVANSVHADSDDPFIEQEPISRYPSSTTLGASDNPRASLYIRSPGMSPHIRNDSLPTNSDAVPSAGTTASDFDDLESHESYSQIMTPTRVPKLERDYSSMSLLQPHSQQMSQGLMRPIRMGEPPKQYHVPPRMPYAGGSYTQSRLPRLQTGAGTGSPVRKQMRTQSEQASPGGSPVPPVSPLGSESVASDASTISSMSPDTPVAGTEIVDPNPQETAQRSSEHLKEHLEGMRIQLESHIKLLREAKQQTINIQGERAAARLAPTTEGRLTALMDAAATDRRIQQSHSFWSFTPQDVKAMENQKRVEAGRERQWTRRRFDPTRYKQLAERALAEL